MADQDIVGERASGAAGRAGRMGIAILLIEVAVVLVLGVTASFDVAAHWRDLLPF
jgi:hypothetical protein